VAIWAIAALTREAAENYAKSCWYVEKRIAEEEVA